MSGGIYLLLGSNLGDRFENLSTARNRIGSVIASSSIYVTSAWGKTEQPDFYNQVIEVDSRLQPGDLLKKILAIEEAMGRIRSEKWGSRIIDIDMLFYRDVIMKTEALTIPHPQIQNRKFTLVPLNELAPSLMHPVLKKTIQQLNEECPDPLDVKRLPLQR